MSEYLFSCMTQNTGEFFFFQNLIIHVHYNFRKKTFCELNADSYWLMARLKRRTMGVVFHSENETSCLISRFL